MKITEINKTSFLSKSFTFVPLRANPYKRKHFLGLLELVSHILAKFLKFREIGFKLLKNLNKNEKMYFLLKNSKTNHKLLLVYHK